MRPGEQVFSYRLRPSKISHKSVLVIRCNGVSDFRVELAARKLSEVGYDVEVVSVLANYKLSQFDLFIVSRPSADMIAVMWDAVHAGKPVLVDIDDDFYSVPQSNPSFNYMGAGHPTFLRELSRFMQAVRITYSTEELVHRYGIPGTVIPNCYDDGLESLWSAKKQPSKMVRVGHTGTNTHREDFATIRDVLLRLCAANSAVQLVIGNDVDIYHSLSGLSEQQKLFIPGMPYYAYPLYFRYVDILTVPLIDNHFNRAKSDIKLVECGVTRTPWVASPLPFYTSWDSMILSGRFADSADEWYHHLEELTSDDTLRNTLANGGELLASARRSSLVGEAWVQLTKEMIGEPAVS